jgi:hypothetical protein
MSPTVEKSVSFAEPAPRPVVEPLPTPYLDTAKETAAASVSSPSSPHAVRTPRVTDDASKWKEYANEFRQPASLCKRVEAASPADFPGAADSLSLLSLSAWSAFSTFLCPLLDDSSLLAMGCTCQCLRRAVDASDVWIVRCGSGGLPFSAKPFIYKGKTWRHRMSDVTAKELYLDWLRLVLNSLTAPSRPKQDVGVRDDGVSWHTVSLHVASVEAMHLFPRHGKNGERLWEFVTASDVALRRWRLALDPASGLFGASLIEKLEGKSIVRDVQAVLEEGKGGNVCVTIITATEDGCVHKWRVPVTAGTSGAQSVQLTNLGICGSVLACRSKWSNSVLSYVSVPGGFVEVLDVSNLEDDPETLSLLPNEVDYLHVLPDADIIVTASEKRVLRVHILPDIKQVLEIKTQDMISAMHCAQTEASGSIVIAVAEYDGTIKVWAAPCAPKAQGTLMCTFKLPHPAYASALQFAGGLLIIGMSSGSVFVGDIVSGKFVSQHAMLHADAVTAIQLERFVMISSSRDGSVKATNSRFKYRFRPHPI